MFYLMLVLVALAGAFFGRSVSGFAQAALKAAENAAAPKLTAFNAAIARIHAEFTDGRRNTLYLIAAVVLFVAGLYVGSR